MPRVARKRSKSGVYHIMFRGNELRDIFIDIVEHNKNKVVKIKGEQEARDYIEEFFKSRDLKQGCIGLKG